MRISGDEGGPVGRGAAEHLGVTKKVKRFKGKNVEPFLPLS